MPHAKKTKIMKESITEKILDIHTIVTNRLNFNKKAFSSEKSIVFDFAWQFSVKYQSLIENIDFETSLFNSFSDGTFLDLFLELKENGETYKVGIEFKFPYKKKNNTGHTEARQKIINDIKRVTWLVKENKIDLGVFICFTNEGNYINEGNYSKAQNFRTHHNKEYKKEEELPSNEQYKENVKCINDIKFEWSNITFKNKKYIIPDNNFAVLKPIFISKMNQQPHDNWATYYDFVYERTYGNFYKQFTDVTINLINEILGTKGTIFDFGAGTGRLTIPLKQQNYTISAIEKSQPMADIIKQKARDLNLSIDIHNCDISDFRNGKADLGLALFTVLSYAITEEQIKSIILNIKHHLNPNGYFIFDLPQTIFFQQRVLADINQPDFKRRITLTPITDDIYQYSETCSGIFNNKNFNYNDTFNIRYWDSNYIDNLLIEHGFKNINRNFGQFAKTGSAYKLYLLSDESTNA